MSTATVTSSNLARLTGTGDTGTLYFTLARVVTASDDTVVPAGTTEVAVTAGAFSCTLVATSDAIKGQNAPYVVEWKPTGGSRQTLGRIVVTPGGPLELSDLLEVGATAQVLAHTVVAAANLTVVASIAALQAVTNMNHLDRAFVQDVGVYRYSSTAADTALGYVVVAPGSGAGRWFLEEDGSNWRPHFNAAMYGMVASTTYSAAQATANKTALNAAIAAAYAVGGRVFIPPGLYSLEDGITVKPGVSIQGYGVTLKRTPSSHYATGGTWATGTTYPTGALLYRNSVGDLFTCTIAGGGASTVEPLIANSGVTGGDGYRWTVSIALKAKRMFTSSSPWVNADDSAPFHVKGLRLDGNRENLGTYTGYELEQASLMFLQADADTTPNNPGRLRVMLEDCEFVENVADAITAYTNVDLTVTNCRAWNCFRGGWTLNGGWTKVTINNYDIGGDVHRTGFDVEVSGSGYDGTNLGDQVQVVVNGMTLAGDLDIGLSENSRSTFIGDNIVMAGGPFNIYGGKTNIIRISNSILYIGHKAGNNNRIVRPRDVVFDSCHFYMDTTIDSAADDYALVNVYFFQSTTTERREHLKFTNCRFFDVSAVTPTGSTTSGSTEIKNVSNPAGIFVGHPISGAGIPSGAFVTALGTNTRSDSITISEAATATATGVSLTVGTVTGTTYGIFVQATPGHWDDELVVDNCEFVGRFTEAIRLNQGGTLLLRNTRFHGARTAIKPVGSNGTYISRCQIDNCRAYDCDTAWLYVGPNDAGNFIEFTSMLQDDSYRESALHNGATTYGEWDTVKDANGRYWISKVSSNTPPNYSGATTYADGAVVNDGAGNFYRSKAGSNVGNALASTTWWEASASPLWDSTRWGYLFPESAVFSMSSGASVKKRGSRVILTSADPTASSTPGLLGDIRRLNVIPASGAYEWICIVESNTAATWRVKSFVGKGPTDASFTVGTEAGNTIVVAVQLKAGTKDLDVRAGVWGFLSDDANGDSITATAPDTWLQAGTDGWLYDPAGAKKQFFAMSEADGDIDVSIKETGTKTWYLGLVLPDGTRVMSNAVTFA